MKIANIYKVSVKDRIKNGRKDITCVATSLYEAVNAVTPRIWNEQTKNSEYIKYKEEDIIEVKLVEQNVIVEDYIPDNEEYNI